MPSTSDYLKTAAMIADEVIAHTVHGDLLTIQWESADIARLKDQVAGALAIEPDNPHIQYIDACLTIAQGQHKTGSDTIMEIARQYPDYIEAQGYAAHPEKWFSPFYYPVWNEGRPQLPDHFAGLPREGTMLVSMRDGVNRIISFFRHCEPGYCTLSNKTKFDINLNLLDTPFGLVAGVYLIIDPGKRTGRFSETMLLCDAMPLELQDMSSSGYWLLRLFAAQSYTFIMLHDTQSGKVNFKKHYFNGQQKRLLASISKQFADISPGGDWDRAKFIKAQQYYMQHVTIDSFYK